MIQRNFDSIIQELFRVRLANIQGNSKNRHSEERKAANNSEDVLYRKLTTELKDELHQMLFLQGNVAELDAIDMFTDGFLCGARLMLDILRPQ